MPAPRKTQLHNTRHNRHQAIEYEVIPTGATAPKADKNWSEEIRSYWASLAKSATAPAYTDAEWQELFLRFLGLDRILKAGKFSPNAWRESLDGIASVEKAVIARLKAGYAGKAAEAGAPRPRYDMAQLAKQLEELDSGK